MRQVQRSSCVEVVVDAPVADVWQVVSDVTRVGEWSHECHAARWLGEVDGPAPGVRFRGRNRTRWARWGRTSEIVTLEPPVTIAWRTVPTPLFPDSTEWRIELAPSAGGTAIRQSFRVLRAPPRFLDRLYATLIPAHQDRDARLAEDLARIGVVAGRGAPT